MEKTAAADRATFNPQDAVAHSNLGNLLAEQGRPQEAEKAYREAIRLNPQDAVAQKLYFDFVARNSQWRSGSDEDWELALTRESVIRSWADQTGFIADPWLQRAKSWGSLEVYRLVANSESVLRFQVCLSGRLWNPRRMQVEIRQELQRLQLPGIEARKR